MLILMLKIVRSAIFTKTPKTEPIYLTYFICGLLQEIARLLQEKEKKKYEKYLEKKKERQLKKQREKLEKELAQHSEDARLVLSADSGDSSRACACMHAHAFVCVCVYIIIFVYNIISNRRTF